MTSPLQVSFRVVGLYCYMENLQLTDVTENSTVKEVMDSIQRKNPAFSYKSMILRKGQPDEKEIVDEITYDFSASSQLPYNTSGRPDDGVRDLTGSLSSTSLVWQYYRSATGSVNGAVCELKLFSQGQPSFANTPLNMNDPFFGRFPDSFQLSTYNLTWRLVQIQMTPEKQAEFMQAKAEAIASGSY
ncbi:hypothetical protein LX97_01966 [Nonlabens dokdonensis]|uniref:Uncharacterized protein n=2 Tax=Nonlabens dokdonensis TaxID=328515 RepID=L7WG29_NONDD|nr:hypothetical protein [Nonlabens dokdonensis]AGC77858.1 hypothetical protein DDD_2731 [Nonlabens dokdonensis DSW-6]PZX39612.1 hypothetical protein LX97_01966 [Nonlabens dokdonensis]